jgi:recombination associated protein RdgC
MFKNLIAYRLSNDFQADAERLEESLEAARFVPCGATEALSAGWVPPRGEPGAALLENIGGHLLLSLRVERRVLPAAVVREKLDEMVEHVEIETGRRPGKKQQRDMKDQATLELLPRAFTLHSHVRVWISPAQGLLMVDAASISKADEVITLLIKAESKLNLHLLQSAESPAACMAAWLMDGQPPKDFVIDRDCEVKGADELKPAVRYTRHNLDNDEVKAHLTSGKMPTKLALTWKERVSFTLTDAGQIKGIKFLDIVFDGRDKPAKDEAFDVDAALATGELAQLIPDLIEGLGGELDFIGQSRAIAAEHAPAGVAA